MLAPTPFVHQVNIRLQQCCVVLVGVYPATPAVCWRFRCFLPRSLLGTTGHTAKSPPGLGVGVLWCHTSDILRGVSEASIGLMVSSWRWARRGNKGREMRTYDRLHALEMTKPGVITDADALQYVLELHAVMIGDRFWRYKHVKRISGSVAIPLEKWLAEAESWVPSLDADRVGLPRPPPPTHEREAEMLAFAAERKEAPGLSEEA